MTTMNNVINTTVQSPYIHLRCTLLNGETWEVIKNVSSLAEEAVGPVVDCLVNGTLDKRYATAKNQEFVVNLLDHAVDAVTMSCFEGTKYKHSYTLELISLIKDTGLCCEECFLQEVTTLHQLIAEHKEGDKTAAGRLVQNLYEFFGDTMPFVFDVI